MLLSSCAKDRSRDPDLAPLIGQTVQLKEAYKLCQKTDSWEGDAWFYSYPLYFLENLGDCYDDYRLIGQVPAGEEVKIVSIEERTTISVYSFYAMVQIKLPREEGKTVEAYLDIDYLSNEFPWGTSIRK
ncbi:MAG: hypothetical protein F6J87_17520 [Spirulina sp. SIO3F2]|nr:hypothetical protein [Spirulina sp. SIO3F2]